MTAKNSNRLIGAALAVCILALAGMTCFAMTCPREPTAYQMGRD